MGKRWDTGDHGSINGYTHGEKTPTPDHGDHGSINGYTHGEKTRTPDHGSINMTLFQGTSNIMCWLSDWIRLIHPMHWFQSLLRSSRRLKPQISLPHWLHKVGRA